MTIKKKSFLNEFRSTGIYLLKIIALAIVYHLAARLGLRMAYVQMNTSAVWPPAGIALAALLLFGSDLWPGITLGVLLGSLLTGASFTLALGMSIGNTLEALLGFYFLHHFLDFHNSLDRIRDVISLVSVSLVITTIGASFGAVTLTLLNKFLWQTFGSIWITWWIGDLLGALVVAPLLLTWLAPPWLKSRWQRYLEGTVIFVVLGVITWYVFSNNPPTGISHQALLYVLFPLMIWVALRFGARGAATGLFLVSCIAILGTTQGFGPFSHESINDSLVLLQTFTAVVSLTSMILAAATTERSKAAAALHQKVKDLAALNDASETFLGTFDQTLCHQAICQLALNRFGLDAAWIELRDMHQHQLKPIASSGITLETFAPIRAKWVGVDQDFNNNHPIVKSVRSLAKDGGKIEFSSVASFPLIFGTKSLGVLVLLSRQKDFFSPDRELLLQSFAYLAAVSIQNSWLIEQVHRGNEQLHGLSQRLMKAQEEERLHLSRELHDESGQLLAALMVQIGLLNREAGNNPALKSRIAELKHITDEIQDDLHKLAVNLRPASLDHLGLTSALQQYINDFNRQYNIKVDFETVGMKDRRLKGDVETAVFRIVQESLTNIVLHAQASQVDILVNLNDNHLVTVIEDNGIGFSPTSPDLDNHLGLFGMRERVEMMGGKFTVESAPGKGTTVKVEVPCHD